jgi:hypothetical protein
MLPIITGREGDLIKIEVTINLSGSMLEAEESILQAVNTHLLRYHTEAAFHTSVQSDTGSSGFAGVAD